MSIKKSKDGDKGGKFANSRGTGNKPTSYKKRPGSKPFSSGNSRVKKASNPEYDIFDKDEIAPPRFLPKKNFSSDRDKGTGYKKKPSDFKDKGSDFKGRGFKSKDSDFKSKDGDFKGVKREGFDRGRSEGFKSKDGDFKGRKREGFDKGRSDGFKSKDGDFKGRKREGFDKDRSDSFAGRKKFGSSEAPKGKGRGEDDARKSFRPKYDPEVKLKRSYKDRKEALIGPQDTKDDIRLNKYLANSGICSRREADELIAQGLVSINGQVVTEMGYKVKKEDVVRYDGRKILPEPYVYILMNKPKDFITTTDDEKGRKTVMDLLADKVSQRVFPIGRLDRNTTGVLLMTNDGEVAQALTHPSFEIKKVYHVVLDKKVSGTDLDKLVEGVELDDGSVFADAATFVDNEDRRHVGVEIHSGRNRVVRRMFEALGYEVEKLDRVSMGIFTKKDLPRGKWRFLSQSEVGFLMKLKSKIK